MTRAVFAVLVLSSCGAVSFDVDQDLQEQTVQGSTLPIALMNLLPDAFKFTIDINAAVAAHGTGPAKSATLKSLTMAITPHSAPKGNFDFLQSAHLFVSANGQPMVEIANITSVAKGATTLDFNIVPNVDLLPYIQAGANISATAMGSQPAMDTSFDGHVTVTVHI